MVGEKVHLGIISNMETEDMIFVLAFYIEVNLLIYKGMW